MLANRLLGSFFGSAQPPQAVSVALFLGGSEVSDGGYRRATVRRGAWQVRGDSVSMLVSFGPFQGTRKFDSVVVLEGDEVLDVSHLTDTATVIPGMIFDATPTIDLAKADG